LPFPLVIAFASSSLSLFVRVPAAGARFLRNVFQPNDARSIRMEARATPLRF